MTKWKRTTSVFAAISALILAGCGGSAPAGSGTTSSSAAVSTSSSDTVYWAQSESDSPNYIFPMTPADVCAGNNVQQFDAMLYRPLYWFGNGNKPTVDYDYSIAKAPVFTDDDKTVTITLKDWKWSNGTLVTSRDVEFFVNLYKANPSANYCDYAPGMMPYIVQSMDTPNSSTIVFHLTRSVSPTWFLYNQLSQITPLPLAWDRTSLSDPAPSKESAQLPDSTKAGAQKVFNFLNAQSRKTTTWAASPLWKVVDGPFQLVQFTTSGEVTMKVNTDYSGSVKPSYKYFVELPFTSNSAEMNEILSSGPKAVTVGYLPPEDIPQQSKAESAGYVANEQYLYSTDYFLLNQHNPKFGPLFRQLYFRQAFQYLVDQQGWIEAFLHGAAHPTYGPVPLEPSSPLVPGENTSNPYPFSVSKSAALLKQNGWDVKPGGLTTCVKPGTASGECGAGISDGMQIAFNLDYVSGVPTLESEMNDLAANAAKVGVKLELTSHPINTIYATAVPCKADQSSCSWTSENWNGGWNFVPDFLPTGESLFMTGGGYNDSNYSSAEADRLINRTLTLSGSAELNAMTAYDNYLAKQLPVVYAPTEEGNPFAGGPALIAKNLTNYSPNAYGYITPEAWSFK